MISSIMDFKRSLQKYRYWYFDSWWFTGEREVVKVHSNSVEFSHPFKEGTSWLFFPKRSECEFKDGGVYIGDAGNRLLFYKPKKDVYGTLDSKRKNEKKL